MITFDLNIHVHHPINQVFDFVASPPNNQRWHYGTLDSTTLSPVSGGAGSFFQTIGHFMGRRTSGTFEVTDYEPNKKYGFRSISGPLVTKTLFHFAMDGLFTRIVVHTAVESKDYFHVSEQTTARKMKKQFKENLEALKKVLEAK